MTSDQLHFYGPNQPLDRDRDWDRFREEITACHMASKRGYMSPDLRWSSASMFRKAHFSEAWV